MLIFGLVSEKLTLVSPTWMWHCKFFVVWCILVRFYSIDISKLYSSVCKVFSVLCILGVLSLLWIWSILFISLINFHTSWYFIWYDYCFGCLFFFAKHLVDIFQPFISNFLFCFHCISYEQHASGVCYCCFYAIWGSLSFNRWI